MWPPPSATPTQSVTYCPSPKAGLRRRPRSSCGELGSCISMTRLEKLRGRVAVISGAGSGIGAGLARFAASRLGMTVVLTDRDLTRARKVADQLHSRGLA